MHHTYLDTARDALGRASSGLDWPSARPTQKGLADLLRGLRDTCDLDPALHFDSALRDSASNMLFAPPYEPNRPLPVREWVRASDADLVRINRECGRTGEAAFRPVPEELRLIRASGGTAAEQERWTHHPDEAVPLAFFEHHKSLMRTGVGVGHRLHAHALSSARAEGVVWTPLLDAMACSWWPGQDYVTSGDVKRHPSPVHHLNVLCPWLPRASAADIDRMLSFRFAHVPILVARNARNVRTDHLDGALKHRTKELVINPHLSADTRHEVDTRLLAQAMGSASRSTQLFEIFALAGEAGLPVRESEPILWDRFRANADFNACSALLANAHRTEAELLEIAEQSARPTSYWVGKLARHPNASRSVWLSMFERMKGDAYVLLAGTPRAVADPEVLAKLRRSRASSVMETILRSAEGDGVAPAFRNWVRSNPGKNKLSVFDSLRDSQVAALGPADVSALFTGGSADGMARLARWQRLRSASPQDEAPKVPLPGPAFPDDSPRKATRRTASPPASPQLGLSLGR
jgi:hypothetical protein